MKQLLSNKYARALATIVIACLIGIVIQTWKSVDNVPFCINAAGCNFSMEPKGQITDRNYGYPLSYRQTSTFIPEHNNQNDVKYAGYAEATTERQPLSWHNILINTLFWSAVLFTISRFISDLKGTKRSSSTHEQLSSEAESIQPK